MRTDFKTDFKTAPHTARSGSQSQKPAVPNVCNAQRVGPNRRRQCRRRRRSGHPAWPPPQMAHQRVPHDDQPDDQRVPHPRNARYTVRNVVPGHDMEVGTAWPQRCEDGKPFCQQLLS